MRGKTDQTDGTEPPALTRAGNDGGTLTRRRDEPLTAGEAATQAGGGKMRAHASGGEKEDEGEYDSERSGAVGDQAV